MDVESLPLIDHHCHGLLHEDLDRQGFEGHLTEADEAGPLGGTLFDSHLGLAVRRWCAPVLGLPAHAPPDDYLERRADLGADEVNRRFLRAAGLEGLCVDTGVPGPLLTPAELADASGARAYEVVRLEKLAEQVAESDGTAGGFADAFRARLDERARDAVGFKSIAAYRVGLALSGERPSDAEVASAAGRLLGSSEPRVADETLHRFLVWCAVEYGKPIQFHIGYGDADLHLDKVNPLLLTDLLQALAPSGVPVMLLHNYPFHREAGYLAQVFPTVFADLSLATHNVGRQAGALLAEALEIVPFGKFLYASDAYALPEPYYLGAVLFRRALARLLSEGVGDDSWTKDDATRIARLITAENARRVYRLGQVGGQPERSAAANVSAVR